MVKNWLTFIAGGLLAPMALFAEIHEVATMHEVKSYFEEAPSKTLGVFDIDETLTLPSESAFQRPNLEEHRDLIKKLMKDLSKEEQFLLLNTMIATIPSSLIEEKTPEILAELQKKNIKLIALTAASSGSAAEIYIPDRRYEELKKHEIDFSSSFPNVEAIEFTDLKQNYGSYPLFTKGILLVNGDARKDNELNSKASVLIRFFDKTDWTPKKIIFVDDKIEHLQEMERALKERHPKISFVGLHYTGAHSWPTEMLLPVDMKNQWNALIKKIRKAPSSKEENYGHVE
jgi:hypothetical protein